MQTFVTSLASNPYAILVGLILSGFPIYGPIIKGAWRVVRFATGAARNGLKKQIAKTKRQNVRHARRVLRLDDHAEYLFINLALIIVEAASLTMLSLGISVALSEKYNGLVPDPIYSLKVESLILFAAFSAAIVFQLSFFFRTFRVRAVLNVRKRILKRRSELKA